jgi:mitochondrial fission protein ELM1
VPNFLKISGLWGIDSKSRLGILDPLICEEEKPDIVISAGRKTAPIAAFLRKKYQAFAVQIMHPNLDFGKFDLVVLPSHDRKVEAKNVVRVLGSLGRVNKDLLEKEYQKFSDIFEKIESPRIVLLVGGSSKKGIFSEKIAQNLGKQVSNVVNQMQGNLVVLNSRRTGDKVSEILDQNLNCPKTFFKWQSPDWQNPYFASLQAADFVIATGDSISMCCEICALGKPVYIFNPPEICSSKHLKFHQDLFDGGFAKRLDEDLRILEKFDSKKLQETAKIAQLPILDRL